MAYQPQQPNQPQQPYSPYQPNIPPNQQPPAGYPGYSPAPAQPGYPQQYPQPYPPQPAYPQAPALPTSAPAYGQPAHPPQYPPQPGYPQPYPPQPQQGYQPQQQQQPMYQPQAGVANLAIPQLGNRLGTYAGHAMRILLFGIGLIVVGVILVVAAFAVAAGTSESNNSTLLVFGVLSQAAGFLTLISSLFRRGLSLDMYTLGFVYAKRGKRQVVRWEDITAVYQQIVHHKTNGVPTGTTYKYTIDTRAGQRIILDNYLGGIKTVGETIQRQTFAVLMPQMLAAFQAGSTLAFGKLSLSQQGISDGNSVVPWNEVRNVKLDNGVITLNRQGKWLSWAHVKVSDTPNVFIFLSLVDQIVGIKTKK